MDDDRERYQARRESFLTIFLTLIAAAAFLLFMIIVTGGFFFYVLLAVVGMALFGLIHYVLWGRAMNEQTAAAREETEAKTEDNGWPLPDGRHPRHD